MNNALKEIEIPQLSAVIMASGYGKRFGSNKLLSPVDGIPMIEKLFKNIPSSLFERVCVVSIYDEILALSRKYGFTPVLNEDKTDDTAVTIEYGIKNIHPDSAGCMFLVGDQPQLTALTIASLINEFSCNRDKICVSVSKGQRGNPVIFPKALFCELASLPQNQQGKFVIKKHPELVHEVNVSNPLELKDIDFPSDIP